MFLAAVCRPLSIVLGFLWPGYASYKALEGRGTEAAAVWLTYWVVYSCLAVLEGLLDPLVGSWMPLYYPLKLALVLWLMLPQTRGASVVYSQMLLPVLRKHEASIDQYLEEGKRRTQAWSAQLLSKQTSSEALDHEQAGGGDFSGGRQGGLRERPAGGGVSFNAEESEQAPVSRSELFDRPTPASSSNPLPKAQAGKDS